MRLIEKLILRWLVFAWIGTLLSISCPASDLATGGVDLHAHLFFHEGIGLPLNSIFGGFSLPIAATSWRDRFRARVNAETLGQSGSAIVVVALYAHPLFLGSQKDSIRRQINEAEKFVAEHPEWIIARTPAQARGAIAAQRRVLILSLEGASWILETEQDLHEFIDQRGIRIVTLLHFTDDEFGGPALLPGLPALVSPLAWVRSFFHASSSVEGEEVRLNDRGLTERGRELVRSLLHRGVWLDLSHSSDQVQKEMIPMMVRAGQPPLFTHTILRKTYHAERGIAAWQLEAVRNRQGVIGIIPSEDMLTDTPVKPPCKGGVPAFLEQVRQMASVVGFNALTVGTDINAPLQFLKPDCATEPASRGFWQYGNLPALWKVFPQRLSVAQFIQTWSNVKPVP